MNDDWQAMQHADECARQQQIVEALERARSAGTPPDVIDLLAYECGVREVFNKEKHQ